MRRGAFLESTQQTPPMSDPLPLDGPAVLEQLRAWGRALGFSQIGVAGIDLSSVEPRLAAWLNNGFHGEMDYMAAHGMKRARPAELVAGTLSVITARLDYLPRATAPGWQAIEWHRLADPAAAALSIYARGRDYHKVLRQRLRRLADQLAEAIGPFGHRVFTDSAPVLEVELAARSGIGWRGKHTLALDRNAGSMFFLGEIFVDVALPETPVVSDHCGSCSACSDDCQLACPWNKFATESPVADFDVRPVLDSPRLLDLWAWREDDFLRETEGSAIRRIGFERWQRNVAVALGNALAASGDAAIVAALKARREEASALVREHIDWALQQAAPAALAALPA